jgi:hypothetical protein
MIKFVQEENQSRIEYTVADQDASLDEVLNIFRSFFLRAAI